MVAISNIHHLSVHKGRRKNIYKKALTSLYVKKRVWEQLKSQRQLDENEIIYNKKIYTIDNVKYYKVIGLEQNYYIEVDSLTYTAATIFPVQILHYTIDGMKCKRALLKIDKNTNQILISKSTLKKVFIPCKFESIS